MPHLPRSEANPLVEAQMFPRRNAHRRLRRPVGGDEGIEGQAPFAASSDSLILDFSRNW